jgi:tRNA U34 5-methylaminomethyl-2-thiouridine-forming methyltransferase MnmC
MTINSTPNNLAPTFEVQVCKDGSSTVFSQQFQQCFHNPNGAMTESVYVFFEQGGILELLRAKGDIAVLEIGFGTGLNAWILADYLYSRVPDGNARFYSVEAFPIDIETALACGYSKLIRYPNLPGITRNVFEKLQTKGMHDFELTPRYGLHVFSGLFDDMPQPTEIPDVIFFDAFSPEKNADLWTVDVFKKLADWSSEKTLLTTYCASSPARANMAEAGWHLLKVPGVLGKREITLAALSPERLPEGVGKPVNRERLLERRKNGEI